MALKLIAAFLQPALAARVVQVRETEVCRFDCGATVAEMPYNGSKVLFHLGEDTTIKDAINKVKYVPRADKCLSQCEVVESDFLAGKTKRFFGALKDAGKKLAKGDVKFGYSGTKSCEDVIVGSQKVSMGEKDGQRLKLCCRSSECPASNAPAAGTCEVPPAKPGYVQEMNAFKSGKDWKEVVTFKVGQGDKVEYKPRPDYCLKDCFASWSALSQFSGLSCNYQKTGHIRVATQWTSGGNFAKLCCVPVRAPADKTDEEEQKTIEVETRVDVTHEPEVEKKPEVEETPEVEEGLPEDDLDKENEEEDAPIEFTNTLMSGNV